MRSNVITNLSTTVSYNPSPLHTNWDPYCPVNQGYDSSNPDIVSKTHGDIGNSLILSFNKDDFIDFLHNASEYGTIIV